MQQRYGQGRSKRFDRIFAISIGTVAVISFLIWAVLFTIEDASRITSRDASYQVNDEYSTTVVFEVTRAPGQEVLCDIKVLNQSYAIVGFKTVLVAPSNSSASVISTTVNTTELGVTGLVDRCRVK